MHFYDIKCILHFDLKHRIITVFQMQNSSTFVYGYFIVIICEFVRNNYDDDVKKKT